MRILTVASWIVGVVNVVWLAIAGRWDVLFQGFVAMIASLTVLPLLLAAAGMFGVPAVSAMEAGQTSKYRFWAFLGQLTTYVVSLAWTSGVVLVFWNLATKKDVVSVCLFAHGVAVNPFSWMASKEVERSGSVGASGFTSMALSLSLGIGLLLVLVLGVGIGVGIGIHLALSMLALLIFQVPKVRDVFS